jgi:hypothetical protein
VDPFPRSPPYRERERERVLAARSAVVSGERLAWGWDTIDMRPDAGTWYALLLAEDEQLPDHGAGARTGAFFLPVAGWLLQEQRPYDPLTFRPVEEDCRYERRLVAGAVEQNTATVEPVVDLGNLWCLHPVGEPWPAQADIDAETEGRIQVALQRWGR